LLQIFLFCFNLLELLGVDGSQWTNNPLTVLRSIVPYGMDALLYTPPSTPTVAPYWSVNTTAIWEDLLLWDRFEIGEEVAKPEPQVDTSGGCSGSKKQTVEGTPGWQGCVHQKATEQRQD
jgi:hypothetical protein